MRPETRINIQRRSDHRFAYAFRWQWPIDNTLPSPAARKDDDVDRSENLVFGLEPDQSEHVERQYNQLRAAEYQ
jgi:hypothetical protein